MQFEKGDDSVAVVSCSKKLFHNESKLINEFSRSYHVNGHGKRNIFMQSTASYIEIVKSKFLK